MATQSRHRWMMRLAGGLVWAGITGLPAQGMAADDDRARLVQQRRQLGEGFAAEERACSQRFAVTACVDDVKRRRREALAQVRERELRLDEAERQQRAAERQAAIDAKRAAVAAAPSASSVAAPELRVRPSATAASRPAAKPRDDGTERAAQAEQRQGLAQQRRDEAATAQQRVQRRQEERSASGRKSAPLPALPAASMPRP